jgi:hypothetical protein
MPPVSVASIALPLADANHHTFHQARLLSADDWRRGEEGSLTSQKAKRATERRSQRIEVACGAQDGLASEPILQGGVGVYQGDGPYGVALGNTATVVLTDVHQT